MGEEVRRHRMLGQKAIHIGGPEELEGVLGVMKEKVNRMLRRV